MKNIEWLLEELKAHFEKEATGHDFWHAQRVYKSALHIGSIENANLRIVEAAALLHDVADWKLEDDRRAAGQRQMEAWLDRLGFTEAEKKAVYHITENMSYKGGTNADKTLSLEGKVVQDADRLDALGAIGIARTFAYGGSKGRPIHDPENGPVDAFEDFEAYKNNEGASLNHFYEKLLKLKVLMNTETGREMAEERDAYMRAFLSRFFKEWEGEL